MALFNGVRGLDGKRSSGTAAATSVVEDEDDEFVEPLQLKEIVMKLQS